MRDYLRQVLRFLKKYQYQLALAAILAYNNWLLGLILNPRATFAGASTSELGATDQPWNMFFRLADSLAGLLFLLGAGAVIGLATSARVRGALIFAMGVLGLSTIDESLFFPLRCSSALSQACDKAERAGLVSWQHSFHIYESLFSYGIMPLLPLLVLWILRSRPNAYRLKEWSYGLLAFMFLWTVETVIRYLHNAASYGLEQRVFIVVFTIWFIKVIKFYRLQRAEKSKVVA